MATRQVASKQRPGPDTQEGPAELWWGEGLSPARREGATGATQGPPVTGFHRKSHWTEEWRPGHPRRLAGELGPGLRSRCWLHSEVRPSSGRLLFVSRSSLPQRCEALGLAPAVLPCPPLLVPPCWTPSSPWHSCPHSIPHPAPKISLK